MNLNINIKNIEDINYINSLNENEIENILNTAISIGLKSIQMSNTFMNGNSYFEAVSLDSLNLENIGFIHLDVEGFEYKVLNGSIGNLPAIVS